MDPATDAAIALAIVSIIEKLLAARSAAKSAPMTADEVLARLTSIQSDLTAGEKASAADADAIIAGRFPGTP